MKILPMVMTIFSNRLLRLQQKRLDQDLLHENVNELDMLIENHVSCFHSENDIHNGVVHKFRFGIHQRTQRINSVVKGLIQIFLAYGNNFVIRVAGHF